MSPWAPKIQFAALRNKWGKLVGPSLGQIQELERSLVPLGLLISWVSAPPCSLRDYFPLSSFALGQPVVNNRRKWPLGWNRQGQSLGSKLSEPPLRLSRPQAPGTPAWHTHPLNVQKCDGGIRSNMCICGLTIDVKINSKGMPCPLLTNPSWGEKQESYIL